jgi:outer membrane protein OmpU
MNKLTKIGVSALAGSLVAVSAHAGSLSASGSASISFADGDVDEVVDVTTTGVTPEGNQWSMGDSITMTGSGDMDNGMSVSVSFEIDNDDVGGGNVYESLVHHFHCHMTTIRLRSYCI